MTDEIQEESQEVINVHVNANANGSLIADTSTSHLFAVFGTLAEALDLVKSFFTDEYLCCSKAQFLDKIREQVADDTEVLRYARDLLFTITKRRKKMYQTSSYQDVSSKFAGRKKNWRWLAGLIRLVNKYQRFSVDLAAAIGSLVVRVLDYRS